MTNWSEEEFWNHFETAKVRAAEATIRTGEPIPEMVVRENESYGGVKPGCSIHLAEGDPKDIPDPMRARYALIDSIQGMVCGAGLDSRDRVNVLQYLVDYWESRRHWRVDEARSSGFDVRTGIAL